MIFLGIDPGNTGCIAAIGEDGNVVFHDIPTVEVKVGKSLKKQLNGQAAALILEYYAGKECFLLIERQTGMLPRAKHAKPCPACGKLPSMGATSNANFNRDYGILLGIIITLKIPYELVMPAAWKKAIMVGMPKEKDAARAKAMQLYPATARELTRKKDIGRADALLIAHYGRSKR